MRALDAARLAFALTLVSPVVHAAEPSHEIKGLYLMTDYPAITVRPGTSTNVALRLQDYGLSPERYQLSVAGVPSGWIATLLGGGQPVGAAMPAPDGSVALQLRLDVPAGNDLSAHTLTVKAEGQGTNAELPIAVSLAKELPAKLSVKSSLPSLRGTRNPTSTTRSRSRTIRAATSSPVSLQKRRPISRPRSPKPTAPRSCPRSRSTPASPRTSS
ncbi:hypothetical protein [Bradyrhizobium sp. RDM4]|uniref:COG1470 family protein n=1 Tax=Bradyrhizobium sp. RDM4 TaxID=3378765 RepID=UPI0038FC990C